MFFFIIDFDQFKYFFKLQSVYVCFKLKVWQTVCNVRHLMHYPIRPLKILIFYLCSQTLQEQDYKKKTLKFSRFIRINRRLKIINILINSQSQTQRFPLGSREVYQEGLGIFTSPRKKKFWKCLFLILSIFNFRNYLLWNR